MTSEEANVPSIIRKDLDGSCALHCSSTPPKEGSPDVLVNGAPAVRVDDAYVRH